MDQIYVFLVQLYAKMQRYTTMVAIVMLLYSPESLAKTPLHAPKIKERKKVKIENRK